MGRQYMALSTVISNSPRCDSLAILAFGLISSIAAAMPLRSPVIFWLLLIATIAVDAVALSWAYGYRPLESFASVSLFAALSGQLSVVCIWSSLRSKSSLWSTIAPVMAVAASALCYVRLETNVPAILAYFGLHAATLLAVLWFFRRTTFWRERSDASSRWRFSIAHLLLTMTVVAVLTAVLRNSELFATDALATALMIAGGVLLAILHVVIWSMPWHAMLRFAGGLAVAIIISMLFLIDGVYLAAFLSYHFVIQAVILSLWLCLGSILPVKEPMTDTAATN
jgi:hypothetical protein